MQGSKYFPHRFAAAATAFITIGIILGGLYALGTSEDVLSEYFSEFFKSLSAPRSDIREILLKNFMIWSGIALSSIVMVGSAINVYTVVHRGFVTGYATVCLCKSFGAKGMLLCTAMLPEMLLLIPITVFFSAFSLKMSFSRNEFKKNFLKKFLCISLFSLTIFCVVSLFQAYLTTTFMNLAYGIICK